MWLAHLAAKTIAQESFWQSNQDPSPNLCGREVEIRSIVKPLASYQESIIQDPSPTAWKVVESE